MVLDPHRARATCSRPQLPDVMSPGMWFRINLPLPAFSGTCYNILAGRQAADEPTRSPEMLQAMQPPREAF